MKSRLITPSTHPLQKKHRVVFWCSHLLLPWLMLSYWTGKSRLRHTIKQTQISKLVSLVFDFSIFQKSYKYLSSG